VDKKRGRGSAKGKVIGGLHFRRSKGVKKPNKCASEAKSVRKACKVKFAQVWWSFWSW
jgi:hypothetical protein